MDDTWDDQKTASSERVIALFVQHRTRIEAYAYAILRNYHEVDDVMQDVAMVLMRKHEAYDPTTPFLPWVLAITRRQSLAQHRSRHRAGTVWDHETLDRFEAVMAEVQAPQEGRMAALMSCLGQVDEAGIGILRMKYVDDLSAEVIAEQTGSTRQAVYSLLQRLRARLEACVARRLGASEGAS